MPILIVLLFIPTLCVSTGYGLFQLIAPRPVRLDGVPGLFVIGVTGMLGLGWIALVAAELGVFSAMLIVLVALLLGVAGVVSTTRRGSRLVLMRGEGRRGETFFLIGLIALMGVLYLRPHEFIFGGADAGVYVNLGAHMARSGSWLVSNLDLGELPVMDYPMLFREHPPHLIPRFYQLPGFYVTDGNAGQIMPQFYPLHPIWMALAYGLGGVWASLFVTPLWGILGVLAFYFAVRESFDARLAMLAALLLAITSTQIWFVRYPTAEALTQFLTFAGLYGFARYMRTFERWPALLAGVALGEVMLVRIDTYFLLGLLLVLAMYLHARARWIRSFWFLAAPMLALSLHSMVHVFWQGWPYFYNTYLAGGAPMPLVLFGAGMLLISVVVGSVARHMLGRAGQEKRVQMFWRYGRTMLAIGLVLLALYAYFVRPALADSQRETPYWYADSSIPDVEPYNLVRLGWYLSPLGLALGVVGIALLVREQLAERSWALIGVGLFFSVLYLYSTFNNPHQIYVMRRYVPVVFPFFALGMAYTLRRLAGQTRWVRMLAIGLAVAQIGWLLYLGRVFIEQVDYQGGVQQFESLAAQIPRAAIVLFNDEQAVGAGSSIGTPLAYLGERTVIDLQEDRLDLDRLDVLVEAWLADGREVFVIDGPARVTGLCDRWRCTRLDTASFDMPVLESSYEHFPTQIVRVQSLLEVYRAEAVR